MSSLWAKIGPTLYSSTLFQFFVNRVCSEALSAEPLLSILSAERSITHGLSGSCGLIIFSRVHRSKPRSRWSYCAWSWTTGHSSVGLRLVSAPTGCQDHFHLASSPDLTSSLLLSSSTRPSTFFCTAPGLHISILARDGPFGLPLSTAPPKRHRRSPMLSSSTMPGR